MNKPIGKDINQVKRKLKGGTQMDILDIALALFIATPAILAIGIVIAIIISELRD